MEPGSQVKHVNDGQLGTLVESPDGLMVKLDRTTQQIFCKYHPASWIPANKAGLSPMQIARVQYAADAAMREACGEYRVPEWISLREDDRIRFLNHGVPKTDVARRALYDGIKELLK